MPAGIKKLKASELSVFCTQISLFLRSGITLVEGLALLEEDLGAGILSSAVHTVYGYVEGRDDLHEALSKTGAFPDYLIKMVRVGEVSGNLEEMMSALAHYYEREQALKQRIKSAVTYPIVLIVMMSAIVLLLIVQVLPMFNDILRSMGRDMPPIVSGIMAFGSFLGSFWYAVIAGILVLILALYFWKRTSGGRAFFDMLKSKLPGLRGINRKIAAERFSTAMAFLLKSSIDMDESLDLAKEILGNRYMAKKIDEAKRLAAEGDTVYDALYKAGVFPKLFTRMLAVGFKTGDLDEMMNRLSHIYEQEVDAALRRATSIIEPAFVAVLSLIVGVILISVMLPLIEVMSSI